MEDVLDVYQRPYDPSRPVICIDETNKQLILEKRIPCKPGEPEKVDSVYVRNGVADIFMISEPLAGKRETSTNPPESTTQSTLRPLSKPQASKGVSELSRLSSSPRIR